MGGEIFLKYFRNSLGEDIHLLEEKIIFLHSFREQNDPTVTLLEKKLMFSRLTMTIMTMIAHDIDHESQYVGVHSFFFIGQKKGVHSC